MKRFESIKKKLLTTALLSSSCLMVAAQEAAAPAEEKSNMLAVLLTVVAIVLVFIIWGMGQALITIGKLVLDKQKKAGLLSVVILAAGFLLLPQNSFAQEANAAKTIADVPNYGGLTANNFYAFVTVIVLEIAAVFYLFFSIRRLLQELIPEKEKAEATSKLPAWWNSLDKKFFTKAVPVEKEADVLLDHNYDGIQELDNSLPPWWKYGFYITIVVAVIYLFNFHVSGKGKNPTQEYAAEMEKAKMEKELFEASNKDKVDENNVPMADAAGIKAGQVIYEADCVACHVKGGGGNVGPNLTDEYWLHKGSLNDIFKSIKNGYPDKGMQAWSVKYNPKEISQLASYVKSLKGTNPPGAKPPQGDLYIEETKPASDSTGTTVKSDSTVVVKKIL